MNELDLLGANSMHGAGETKVNLSTFNIEMNPKERAEFSH
jgi:hypothetical protein